MSLDNLSGEGYGQSAPRGGIVFSNLLFRLEMLIPESMIETYWRAHQKVARIQGTKAA